MRESIGGAFLLKIMVVFIVLYNTLLAIAVNYAVAFRVKNQIINIIEQSEGCVGAGDRVRNYVNSVGYYRAATPIDPSYTVTATYVANRGTYYKVTTFIKFDFPWVGQYVRANIIGETKTLYGINESNTHCRNI